MENVKDSYKYWSKVYDTNENKTRDLDLKISKELLSKISFESVLEIGCGTGKNTLWLSKIAKSLIAVDFSPEMIQIAKRKVNVDHVQFVEADISKTWKFNSALVDLISINLVLEHIENLDLIFDNAAKKIKNNGFLFISELHPFKQYLGSQAKYENQLVKSHIHHISDYFKLANKFNFKCEELVESFDDIPKKNEENIPRLISLLFKKN